MKLVIDIDEELYNIRNTLIFPLLNPDNAQVFQDMMVEAIKNGTPLPNNATNGDVIKALFPDYTYVGTCVLDKYENILLHDVNYHWWNTLYTKENEDGSNI